MGLKLVALLLGVMSLIMSIAEPPDSLFPYLGNEGYDVQHYDIRLQWNEYTQGILATARLDILTTKHLSQFALDLQGLEVHSVKLDGQLVDFGRTSRKLIITPRRALERGQTFNLEIQYGGIPQADRESGTRTARGWNQTEHGVYVVSEPSGASTWYPCNDHPTDKATYDLHITVPNDYDVAATGSLERIEALPTGQTYHYHVRDLTASYLLTVNIGDYIRVESQTASGLLLRSFYPNTGQGSELAQRDHNLEAMIAFFSTTFGAYPFEAYGILVEPAFSNANEMQTLPIFHPRLVQERVMAHELAHQWFGNHVTLHDWSELWLNEGFATYAEYLWMQQRYGASYVDPLYTRRGYESVAAMPAPIPADADDLFHVTVYQRGAWTLHALRLRVGDATFFAILRDYYQTYGGSHASTDDFIRLAEAHSGQDLEAFFHAWLYAPTPPPVPNLRD